MVALIIALILAGAAVYIINALPIDATFKLIAKVIIVVAFAVYALRFLAPLAGLE